jgi:cell division protein ZapB
LIVLDEEMQKLEERVSSLVGVCRRLKEENHALRAEHRTLTKENAQLAEKTRLARTRIEAIIGKLKALEGRA